MCAIAGILAPPVRTRPARLSVRSAHAHPLTELLDIEHPVMLAGMGGVSYHRLVAAVSEAGGIGTLGASTMGADELAEEMAKVRELTAKPFGVDLLTAMPGQVERGHPATSSTAAPASSSPGSACPATSSTLLHDANVLVGIMCGKVRHAVSAVASGCDFVVAQGTEAGGHTGTVATMALVPQVVDAVGDQVPVVAAGGLFDGRGLAAALALGADGVWIGTRFIATPEARAVDGYKETLLRHARGRHRRSAGRYTGKTCRVVRNDWTQHFEEHPDELQPFPAQAFAVDAGRRQPPRRTTTAPPSTCAASSCRAARASARSTRSCRPASSSRQMVAEAERALSRASATRGDADDHATSPTRVDAVLGRRHPPDAARLHPHPQRLRGVRRRLGEPRPHGARPSTLIRDWCAARADRRADRRGPRASRAARR